MDPVKLIEIARAMRERSHCPYSGYAVGAALLCKDGSIVGGCNVESASFSPTSCAERTALTRAVAEGRREFIALAVAGGPADGVQTEPCLPCGVCRQFLCEWCPPDMPVYCAGTEGDYTVYTMAQLLPVPFTGMEIPGR